jgi:tellurite resistance-related uncharacterized protein
MSGAQPYKSTPVFDEHSLPAGLRRDHSTKPGAWGVIRVLEGELLYEQGGETRTLTPATPALILPEQTHRVEPLGPMRMRVDFYNAPPLGFGDEAQANCSTVEQPAAG